MLKTDQMHFAEGQQDSDENQAMVPDPEDITLGQSLQLGPALQPIVFSDSKFLQAVHNGYKDDRLCG